MSFYRRVLSASVVAGVGVLYGCSDATTYDFDGSLATVQQQVADAAAAAPPVALFDPKNRVFPFPNSLFFDGSEDGTLNIALGEGVEATDLTDVTVSLNALDGYSTTSPVTMQIGGAVDADSVTLGDTVRVFEVQTAESGAVTQVIAELDQTQVAASLAGDTVAVVPVVPLKESTDYVVIATNGITSPGGVPVNPSTSFILVAGDIPLSGPAAGLEPIRQLTNAMIAAVAAEGVDAATIVQAFSFKTQSLTPVLQAVKSATTAQAIAMEQANLNTNNLSAALPGIADIYRGTLELPYYRTAPANANDPAGISSFWQGQGGSNDNLRQSAADLMALSASIGGISAVPVNASRKTVIGYSLGGASATPFLAFDDSINAATLAMPAAGLVGTTLASQAFGPDIIAGLEAAGVEQGTAAFEQFKVVAQTVIDSGDAINFGSMAAQNMPIHMTEVIGDTTVPNNVDRANSEVIQ